MSRTSLPETEPADPEFFDALATRDNEDLGAVGIELIPLSLEGSVACFERSDVIQFDALNAVRRAECDAFASRSPDAAAT